MKIFKALLEEISLKKSKQNEHINNLESFIDMMSNKLLDDKFNPSQSLKNLLDKYKRRAKYPMEVAIVGQFSSGKSTFLNALLSKDVLPTGITPVTSKVNFLNYGDEYKLKITFKSGATEFHAIEHLAKFTDQREAIQDIKYLSIYAPVEMLREISFVDTPGLNSQSKFDTDTTNSILRDVDGIIWLGLIDSVAKKTELDTLDKYLPNYANKSVCLLNQKDRLEESEVQTALNYAKQNYKNYFSKIIAISARQALGSRINQKQNLLFSEKNRFIADIKDSMLSGDFEINDDFFVKKLDIYNKNIENIKDKDYDNYIDELESSNILDVLEFINNSLRPKAKEAKIFAIKKDFSSLCKILQNEYTRITQVYSDLAEIIDDFSYELQTKLKDIQSDISTQVEMLNIKINEGITSNVGQIYSNIKPIKKYLIKEKKSLLGTSLIKEEYQSYYMIESSSTYVSVKSSIDSLNSLVKNILQNIRDVLKNFEKELTLWQIKNEKLIKNREVASDIEFSIARQFASGIYENILKNFTIKYDDFENKLNSRVYKISFKNRFELAYEKTINQLSNTIVNMQNLYEKHPDTSVINSIEESEILLMFKEHVDFNYLKREFQKDDSFIKADSNDCKKEMSLVMQDSIKKIHRNFEAINNKVKLLDEIKSSVNLELAI